MVNPLYLIAILLGTAFLHPLVARRFKGAAQVLVLAVIAFSVALPALWLASLNTMGQSHVLFDTAGFRAPFSIPLQVGVEESLFLLLVNAGAFLGAMYFMLREKEEFSGATQILLLTLLLGSDGLILTRDLFNMFVFMEISSISLYGLVAKPKSGRSFEAGIKLMVAGGIASALYLVGVIFLYRLTGTLNLDEMILRSGALKGVAGAAALGLLTLSLLIELKPFPANGWGADVYQATDPGISALISGTSATAVFFVLYKITPLLGARVLQVAAVSGGVTFLASQILAYKQDSTRRMLGYSSIGQIGLLILVIALGALYGEAFTARVFGGVFFVVLLLAGNHLLSKAGLFWVSGIRNDDSLADSLSERPGALAAAGQGILTSALAGFPPFPGFWAKWMLVTALIRFGSYSWAFVILLGSLVEAAYLFRWFLTTVRKAGDSGEVHDEIIPSDFPQEITPASGETRIPVSGDGWLAPALAAVILAAGGAMLSIMFLFRPGAALMEQSMLLIPLAALLLWGLLDLIRIPFRIQIVLALAASGLYAYLFIPSLDGIRQIFGLIFIAGSAVQMITLLNRRGSHRGLAALLTALVFSLGNLLFASSALELFFSWELMTVTSFFLIVRGRKASGAALRYLVFSLAGAFSILAGLALGSGVPAAILLGLGFLTKMGTIGFHIWLPGAYAESDDDLSTFFSSVLSKAGLLMMFLLAGAFMQDLVPGLADAGTRLEALFAGISIAQILGWLGAATAFAGAFLALFKEDIKYTLAYSSMGQVGYMLLSFSLMTQLGWMNSLYLAVTHLLFKGMLFIAIAGVIYRTNERMMYKMGGLISRMPVSFFTVLIGIIALSGVPPLTGFGAKWMLYTALIEEGWYLQAAVAMFASGIAFLYLFRLIHVIFLGQLKDEHRNVKEAPVWFLIPQIAGIAGIMLFSVYPSLLLKPLEAAVAPYFSGTIAWDGYTVLSTLGYWNGTAVMFVTVGVFLLPLIWLLIVQRKNTQKVGQFNIVFAAERPHRPETTHFGYNFFAPYEKALGFLKNPVVSRFWYRVLSVVEVTGSAARRLYSGNIQTQALWIVLYSSILLLILQRGL